jgi:hypothetical protein
LIRSRPAIPAQEFQSRRYSEEFHDRYEIRFGLTLFVELLAKLPVAKQPFADIFRQEPGSHHRPPLMSVAKQASAASLQAVKSM